MGQNWFKNRPKPQKKSIKKQTQVAVTLDDESTTAIAPEASDTPELIASETAAASDDPDATEQDPEFASGTPVIASETIVASAPAEIADSLLLAWEKLERHPFEYSPFSKMLLEAGKTSTPDGETVVAKIKPTVLLDAPFVGIMETETDTAAIIGGRLFKAGEEFQGKKIKKVEGKTLYLEDDNGFYVMPKKGVTVSIATDGTYFVTEDSYEKN